MIESATKPPAICRRCRDCAHCAPIHWAFCDANGVTCAAFEPDENDELAV